MSEGPKDLAAESGYQFLIVLLEVDPLVWRRIHVPGSYNFWDLHVAIQDSMGWQDRHLHEFRLHDPDAGTPVKIGIPYDDVHGGETLPGFQVPLTNYFQRKNDSAIYVYDFGDGWRHLVAFEEWIRPGEDAQSPRCISGARNCPPEDCGGPWGYERLLDAIRNPDHEGNEELLLWFGGSVDLETFDPDAFYPEQVRFDDPEERWRKAFEKH